MTSKKTFRFFGVEKLTLYYILITSIIVCVLGLDKSSIVKLLGNRLLITVIIVLLVYISSKKDLRIIRFIRNAFIGVLLIFWYPDTFGVNQGLSNYDHILAKWEQMLFGFQPALSFCHNYPNIWLSEIMNMAYFSYYPLIVCTGLYFYFSDLKQFRHFYFTVLFSFFAYYLIFILFPTAGPQYYFSAIGLENVKSGIFPAVGAYFHSHTNLLTDPVHSGFFHRLVESTQQVGERPTAAFPSSHVGMSTLIMILIFQNRRYIVFAMLFPIYTALVFSTVYIQAHYAIDIFAGLITAPILLYISQLFYNRTSYAKAIYKTKSGSTVEKQPETSA